ncbi:MAG: type I-C CRISPR-associated protein Cas8c/Csd1, partial [Rhodobacteraceae bacterium]|nr:type I-C CRISPR-associated protein Cas8c/Csd1 [Paracoccaceae bacterium]
MSFLRELIKAYDKLPDHKKPEYGYSLGKASYCINLKDDGNDFEVIDIRQSQNNNALPKNLFLPFAPTRSGSKINPHFLWDNIEYVLGSYKLNEKTGRIELDQTNLSKHKEFKKKHLEFLLQKNEQIEIKAFCNFIKSWEANGDQLEKLLNVIPFPNESKGDNFVFAHENSYQETFLHEDPNIKEVWLNYMNEWNEDERIQGTCFLTGNTGTIQRLHPLIKGVYGSHTKGAPLISFNKNSFNSFGRKQGYNAPVSGRSTFYYSTALNAFLNDEQHK